MSLFINNHNGPIYHECNVTINQGQEPKVESREEPTAPNDARCADILPIPGERKYSEVRHYIEERKRFDEEFKTFCANHSLRDLCVRLTKEFGWFVDEHSLGANLNRNR